MNKAFQLDLLSALAASAAQGLAPPPPLEITDEVLNVVIDQAQAMIQSDARFRQALEDALRRKKGRSPSAESVEKLVKAAVDLATSRIRQELSGRRVEGTWPVVESMLRSVFDAQAKTFLSLGAADLSKSGSPLEGQLFSDVAKEVELAKQTKEFAERFCGDAKFQALDRLAKAYLEGRRLPELLDDLRSAVKFHIIREILREKKKFYLQELHRLMREGRVWRFEIEDFKRAFDALEEPELPREAILSFLEGVLLRKVPVRLSELQNPWEVKPDAGKP